MTRSALAAAITAAAALAPAAAAGPAVAAAPKLKPGKYICNYLSSERLFGQITLASGKTYKWNGEKGGKYAVKGSTLTFKTGPMAGAYEHARVRRTVNGSVYFNLFDGPAFGHHDTDANCLRTKS